MHSASGPSPMVKYSNVRLFARTLPRSKSGISLLLGSATPSEREPTSVLCNADQVGLDACMCLSLIWQCSPWPAALNQGRGGHSCRDERLAYASTAQRTVGARRAWLARSPTRTSSH